MMTARTITADQFQELLTGEKPFLAGFWAPWCSYCRRLGPAYNRIAEQYADALEAVQVNIDEEPGLAETEQIEVIPTLVLYRGGSAIGSIVTPESKPMIEAFLQETLFAKETAAW